MLRNSLLLAALLLGSLAVPAAGYDRGDAGNQGGDRTQWSQVGAWRVEVDRRIGDRCYAWRGFEDGTVLRVGVSAGKGDVHFAIANEQWRSLEAGKLYRMVLVFDNGKTYDGELLARSVEGLIVLYEGNVGSAFAADFMTRNSLRLYHRGVLVTNLTLHDTDATLRAIVACQKAKWATRAP